jgi:hypothetical protein
MTARSSSWTHWPPTRTVIRSIHDKVRDGPPPPHQDLRIGHRDFANEWAFRANSYVLSSIDSLDHRTPGARWTLWGEYEQRFESGPGTITTTIYQFGVSENTGAVIGFTYRSTNAFTSRNDFRLPASATNRPRASLAECRRRSRSTSS